MIQRVYAVLEVGLDETSLMTLTPAASCPVDIPEPFHWRNEKAIAAALRQIADEIEHGDFFTTFPPTP